MPGRRLLNLPGVDIAVRRRTITAQKRLIDFKLFVSAMQICLDVVNSQFRRSTDCAV